MDILGIDVGGSGIKGAPVDTTRGELLAERIRLPTPEPSKPKAIAEVITQIALRFNWKGPIGCGFPAVMRRGVALTAANIHKSWIGTDAAALFSEATGCRCTVINDADAAGLAEIHFGAGRRHQQGVVLIVTVGTGIGTALFVDGHLLPNTELGHIEMGGQEAEAVASDAARKREDLKWDVWAARFDAYLQTMERLFWPDLIIIGGGIVKKQEKFMPLLNVRVPVVPAQLGNNAGIVGAALAAEMTELVQRGNDSGRG